MRTNPSTDGHELDSPEEQHFLWWIEELQEAGFIRSWRKASTYALTEPLAVRYTKPRASKATGKPLPPKIAEKRLRTGLSYTPDFQIEWSLRAYGLFCFELGDHIFASEPQHHFVLNYIAGSPISVVEVKPKIAGRNAMNHSRFLAARMNAEILFHRHGIFANLVEIGPMPKSLFDRTFTPRRFLLTDKTEKPRTIHFEPRTLASFVASSTKLKIATL
jgi:hypothetical protein